MAYRGAMSETEGRQPRPYGWCGYCPGFTYRDLWHGACGDCRWRWGHYPDTMPAALHRYRAEMTYGHGRQACAGSNCPVYGEKGTS
jgi:hypothetical protein